LEAVVNELTPVLPGLDSPASSGHVAKTAE
jgi:hypothetical protein